MCSSHMYQFKPMKRKVFSAFYGFTFQLSTHHLIAVFTSTIEECCHSKTLLDFYPFLWREQHIICVIDVTISSTLHQLWWVTCFLLIIIVHHGIYCRPHVNSGERYWMPLPLFLNCNGNLVSTITMPLLIILALNKELSYPMHPWRI